MDMLINDVTQSNMRQLALELRLLRDACHQWVVAWQSFPPRVSQLLQFLHQPYLDDMQTKEEAGLLVECLLPLFHKAEAGLLLPGDLTEWRGTLREIVSRLQKQPDHRRAGALYSELHGKLENLTYLIMDSPHFLLTRSEACLELIGGQQEPHVATTLQVLNSVLAAVRTQESTSLADLEKLLSEVLIYYPPQLLQNRVPSPSPSATDWIIVAVEDDPIWQETIAHTVDLLRIMVGPTYHIGFEVQTCQRKAEAMMEDLTKRPLPGGRSSSRQPQVLAILDMGLPEVAGGAPSRDTGYALLESLRAKYNVPTVILTTPSNFLGDHARAYTLGVTDYLLKDLESEEQLRDTLFRIVTMRLRRTIRLMDTTENTLVVDDIEVTLDPVVFRTLSVLVDEGLLYQRPRAITPERIVELLDRKYGGYIPWPEMKAGATYVNHSSYWAKALQAKENPIEALRWLEQKAPNALWRSLSLEFQARELDQTDLPTLARYMEQTYGFPSEAPEEYSPKNIEKHVYQVREAIKRSFNAVGRTVVPEEEILVNTMLGDHFAYKLIADVVPAGADEPVAAARVLVVENDVEGWLQPIAGLLQRHHYEVRVARYLREAVDVAREFKPDILCLDMQLPRSLADFIAQPLSGDLDAGLDVLEEIRTFIPDVRAISLTDWANRDDLRTRAATLGIRPTDFVPKRFYQEKNWSEALILRLHRVEQEIRRHALLPLPSCSYLPALRFLRNRKSDLYLEVHGHPWSATPMQFKLLWLLAENDNRPVPTERIMAELYGLQNESERPQYDNKLKMLVRNLRDRIGTEWLNLQDKSQGAEAARMVLANDAKNGYLLNARILFE